MKRFFIPGAILLSLMFVLIPNSGMADTTYRVVKTLTDENAGAISCLAFSPDGTILVSGTENGTVIVRDVTTGNVTKRITAYSSFFASGIGKMMPGLVKSIAFSPDGKVLATSGSDGAVTLWNASTWEKLRDINSRANMISSLAFSPDGKVLAGGGGDVSIWDAASGERLKNFDGHAGSINTIVYSKDGKMLASGSMDRTVIVWDATTGARLVVLDARSRSVESIDMRADGLLASGGNFPNIILWDPTDGAMLKLIPTMQSSVAQCVRFSPDGRKLAAGFRNGSLAFWDTKEEAWKTYLYHGDQMVNSIAFSKDGKLFASADTGGKILMWSALDAPSRITIRPQE